MPIDVQVREEDGRSVDTWRATQRVELVLKVVLRNPDLAPVLGGVDPHADTVFSTRQCHSILRELLMLEPQMVEEDCRLAWRELVRLLDLFPILRKRPYHRKLHFLGD